MAKTRTADYVETEPSVNSCFMPSGKRRIKQTLDILGMPKDQYFVIGGANLVLRDILHRTIDIDMLVSDSLFEGLQWVDGSFLKFPPEKARDRGATNQTVANNSLPMPISATTSLGDGYYPMSFDDNRESVELVDGIPCISLDDVIASKEALQRPKDITHLHRIARHLGTVCDLPEPTIANPILTS